VIWDEIWQDCSSSKYHRLVDRISDMMTYFLDGSHDGHFTKKSKALSFQIGSWWYLAGMFSICIDWFPVWRHAFKMSAVMLRHAEKFHFLPILLFFLL